MLPCTGREGRETGKNREGEVYTMAPCTGREGREAPSSQPESRAGRVLVGWQRAPAACMATTITSMHAPAGHIHAEVYDHHSYMPPPPSSPCMAATHSPSPPFSPNQFGLRTPSCGLPVDQGEGRRC